jgi:hypothetical protein
MRRGAALAAGVATLALAVAAHAADGTSNRIILGTRDGALASALAVAVSPRGLSVMELSEPLAGVHAADAARREVLAHDGVAVVWLCDDDAGAHGLCFVGRDGHLVRKSIAMTPPLEPPDAAALALSVKLMLGPAAAPAPPAPAAPAAAPVTREAPAPPAASLPRSSTRSALGLSLAVLPAGTISVEQAGVAQPSAGAAPAVAVAPFLDYSPLPQLSVGLSPQLVFNVKPSGASSPGTEYDLRARVTFGLPLSGQLLVFARLSPGYSFVDLPGGAAHAGLVLDASAGVELALTQAAFLVGDAGYQLGFQQDARTRYPHVGVGLGFALGR